MNAFSQLINRRSFFFSDQKLHRGVRLHQQDSLHDPSEKDCSAFWSRFSKGLIHVGTLNSEHYYFIIRNSATFQYLKMNQYSITSGTKSLVEFFQQFLSPTSVRVTEQPITNTHLQIHNNLLVFANNLLHWTPKFRAFCSFIWFPECQAPVSPQARKSPVFLELDNELLFWFRFRLPGTRQGW